MTSSIRINKKTTRFFIAIAKKIEHSFVMLGIYEDMTVPHLLSRVGKGLERSEQENPCAPFRLTCFGSVKSQIFNERIVRDSEKTSINYQAFDITYEQYCQFIGLLERLQTAEHRFDCFKPIIKDEEEDNPDDNNIELVQTSIQVFSLTPIKGPLEEDKLSISNTCRHTAIKLVEEVEGVPLDSFSSLISSFFLKELPYATYLNYGIPSAEVPFYVLPVPPVNYPEQNAEQKALKNILKQLYWRMEKIALLEPQALETQAKFSCLKEKYLELFKGQEELSLYNVLESIQHWRSQCEEVLSTHRRLGFWSFLNPEKTATMTLIDDIEEDLKQKIKL